jgi:hypothetical protein
LGGRGEPDGARAPEVELRVCVAGCEAGGILLEGGLFGMGEGEMVFGRNERQAIGKIRG